MSSSRIQLGGSPIRPAGYLLIAFLPGLILATPARGQQETARLDGGVTEDVTDAPLPTARVVLEPRGDEDGAGTDPAEAVRTVSTGEGGRFHFPELPAGTYLLRVTLIGYETVTRRLSLDAGEHRRVSIVLKRRPVEIPEVGVTVEGRSWVPGFLERREHRPGHFVTRADVARRDPSHLHELFRGMSGVHVEVDHSAHGYDKYIPLMYDRVGPGLWCRPAILVDGSPLPRFRALNAIPPHRIIGMEVYPAPSMVPDSVSVGGRMVAPSDRTPSAAVWQPPPLPPPDAGPEAEQGDPARHRPTPVGPSSERGRGSPGGSPGLYAPHTPEPCGAILVWTSLNAD